MVVQISALTDCQSISIVSKNIKTHSRLYESDRNCFINWFLLFYKVMLMLMNSSIAVAFHMFVQYLQCASLCRYAHWLVGWNYWFEFVFQSVSASPAREQIKNIKCLMLRSPPS